MKSQDDLFDFARAALGFSEPVPMDLKPLDARGSDRSYFRLKWAGKNSAILVQYDPKRIENAYYADIAEFLLGIDVPVARLIRHDPSSCLILMEDLGRSDLWSLRNRTWELRGSLYKKTLDVVQRLHSFPLKDFPSRKIRLMEGFGPELYRWERDYFRENFICVLRGMKLEQSFQGKLEEELAGLADRLARGAHCLVHRDLQSQNVMIRDGQVFLIDFQGMRIGNPFYDLGASHRSSVRTCWDTTMGYCHGALSGCHLRKHFGKHRCSVSCRRWGLTVFWVSKRVSKVFLPMFLRG